MNAKESILNNLKVAEQLATKVEGFLGQSVKCIVDADGNYVLTRDGLKYLKAIDEKHPVYNQMYEYCYTFNEKVGFGSEEFILYVGCWCACFKHLLRQDIPLEAIKFEAREILDVLSKHLLQCKNAAQRWNTVNQLQPMLRAKSKNKNGGRVMKYSRHANIDVRDDTKWNEFFKNLIQGVAHKQELLEEDLEILAKLMDRMYEDLNRDGDFVFASNSVKLKASCSENFLRDSCRKVFDGILIPCSEAEFESSLLDLREKFVNILLINNIAYGTTLGDEKTLKIKETMSFKNFIALPQVDSGYSEMLHKLRELNVEIVFYRGCLDNSFQTCCDALQVITVCVDDYEIFNSISSLTGTDILYSFDETVSSSEITKIQISFIPIDVALKDTKRERITKNTKHKHVGYIEIHNSVISNQFWNQSSDPIYTLFLSSRTDDLFGLLEEKYNCVLKKIEHFLRSKIYMTGLLSPERVILKHFECDEVESSSVDSYFPPTWLISDLKLFHQTIKVEISKVFEEYIRKATSYQMESDSICLEDVLFRVTLWKASLDCVLKLSSCVPLTDF